MQVRTHALVLGALVVGAVVAVDPGGLAPFGPAKWLLVSTLGALGIGLTLRTTSTPSASTSATAHRGTWWLWAGLLALLTISALTSDDVPTALLGQPDRHFGVLTWLLVWGLFVAGQRLDLADRRTVTLAAAIGAVAVGGWAVAELFGGHLVAIATDSRRLTGPFGSAAFLGAGACLLLPVAAGVAAARELLRAWRIVGAVGALTTTVALVGSGARAAWFGAVAATVVLLLARRSVRRRIPLLIGIAVAACCVLAPRLGEITARPHGATSRVDEWTVAARVIGEHPLLGVGPEGYRIAAADGIDRHYERTYGRDEVLPDRAHSAPLDVALAGGIPAATSYVALVGFVVWRAVRRERAARSSAVDIGLAVGVIAYAAQQLLLFPLAELDPIWWLCCGMVVARPEPSPSPPPAQRVVPGRQRVVRAVGLGACAFAGVAIIAGILDVAADRLARRGLDATSVDDADRAADLRPDDVRYRLVAAVVHGRRGSLHDVDLALDQMAAAHAWSPDDPLVLDERASLLSQRATITGVGADVGAALDAWRALVRADPHRARWQLELGRAAALAGDVDEAGRAWRAAADLDPSDPTAPTLLAALAAP